MRGMLLLAIARSCAPLARPLRRPRAGAALRASRSTATTDDFVADPAGSWYTGGLARRYRSDAALATALRFFFTHTLDRPGLARKLVRTAHARKIPVVLTQPEVKRLLDATTCLKHQAALSVAYGAGLRVGEVSALKVRDIDSKRMLLRIERGKGGRYRNAMLPEGLLVLLREWWRAGRQQGVLHADGWLFPGQNATVPISWIDGMIGTSLYRSRKAFFSLEFYQNHDICSYQRGGRDAIPGGRKESRIPHPRRQHSRNTSPRDQ